MSHTKSDEVRVDTSEAEDPQRRNLARVLLGALGGVALLDACAAEPDGTPELLAQTAQGVIGISSVVWVDNTTDLKGVTGQGLGASKTTAVIVLAPSSDDGGTVFLPNIQPTSPDGPGYWKRIHSGLLNVKWFGAKGDGTNDAPAFSAAITAATASGAIVVPAGTFSIATALTISCAVSFDNGGVLALAGATTIVTITGALSAPGVGTIFANASPIPGTTPGAISFAANRTLTSVRPEWWGARADDATAATINAAALNAANLALVTRGSGEIVLGPGSYDFNSTLKLGDDAVAFTGISLGGTNGLVGSSLRWTGAVNGVALYVTRGRLNHLHDFALTNANAKGTLTGLLVSGPDNNGTNTTGVHVDRVSVSGFHIGFQMGGGTGNAASELIVTDSGFSNNDIGFKSVDFNTLNLWFYGSGFESNAQYGLDIGAGNLTFDGGSFGRNGTSFYISSSSSHFRISGIRDEAVSVDYRFFHAAVFTQSVLIDSCGIASTTQFNNPMVLVGGGPVTLINNTFAYGSNRTIIPFGTALTDGVGNGAQTSLTMIGNRTNGNAPLFQYSNASSAMDGLRYTLIGNCRFKDDGNLDGQWPDERGTVIWPARVAVTDVGAAFAASSFTPAQITSDQNDYAPRNPAINTVLTGVLYLRLTSDATRTLTGLVFAAPARDGQTHYIINAGSNTIVLAHENAGSASANRFHTTTAASLALAPDQQALLVYDATIARWRASRMA